MTLAPYLLAALLLFAAAPARCDLVRILDDPGDAAQVRVDLIQQATEEVSVLYFLVRNDRVTHASLALLRDARRRGVPTVRLLADANFTRIPKPLLAHLHEEGVQVRVYHPFELRHPSWLFRRMHEKLTVVDGRRYVTGGRNLAEAYFGLADRNYVDRDVYVDGESAAEARRHFDAVWSSRHVFDLDVHVRRIEVEQAAALLDGVMDELRAGESFATLDTGRDWSEGAREVGAVRFVHDPIEHRRGERVANQIHPILEGATRSILIESPYLVPSRAVRELLARKRAEGVRVVILTNSKHSTDAVFPHAAYVGHRSALLETGIEIFEFKGPDMLHAKSFVVDGRILGIGSYNLDPRSQNLNSEVMCVAEDDEAAAELTALIEERIAASWPAGEHGANGPRVSRGRKVMDWVARTLLLLPVIEGQL
ncbi:MAG TPA: phosphatidylserine/phosphatidylglycerophosphate/cardiolipin synthase family protein [Thermoanaerobaculia bacterium]|nr:phosphatidylserine/phosphatidylglycerophosphate/cardiolipin synthase family protein [Thermoanaerobaculia bacterium]